MQTIKQELDTDRKNTKLNTNLKGLLGVVHILPHHFLDNF